jgi:hypothetical protein
MCFFPDESASASDWMEGWVGRRAGVVAVEKRNISCPYRESNPEYFVAQQPSFIFFISSHMQYQHNSHPSFSGKVLASFSEERRYFMWQ